MDDMTPEQCRATGGHHWLPQRPGHRNTCERCGYQGLVYDANRTK